MHAFLRMVIGSTIGIFVGLSYDNTARPLALALLASGIVSLLLVLYSEKGRLFRRIHPPGTPRPIVLEH